MPYKDKGKQRTYQNSALKTRRRAWLALNGPCRVCASWEALEVDHIRSELKTSHRIWSWSQARRDKELANCQALCKPCHLAKSNKALAKRYSGAGSLTAKLSIADVITIRLLAHSQVRQATIAKVYGVSASCISAIVRNDSWRG